MNNFMCVDRVAFTLFGHEIYWYGVFMCLAIVSCIVMAVIYCKKRELPLDTPINVALVAIPFAILGGRLFAVLFDANLELSDYFKFRDGGMSIMGCIVGASLSLTVYSIIKAKITKSSDIFLYFDVICAVLLLGQAIGRWGNFFNGEVYGQYVSSSSIFSRFPFAVEINGVRYQALFFFECVTNFIGFIFTSQMFLQVRKDGYTTGFYLMYYGVTRAILEKYRQPAFILKIGSIPVSTACSILMIVAGAVVLGISIYRHKKKKEAVR